MATATLVERADLSRAARSFLRTESGSAALLLIAAVTAVLWANTSATYEQFWRTELALEVGAFELGADLRHWVNDGLMVLFFFSVGMELAREMVHGELRGRRAVAAPLLAALGGLSLPAALYLVFTAGGPGAQAWGIAISTDTAVLLGVLALVGPRCPDQLRVFLLALAIFDDVGAVAAIAVFYTEDLQLDALLAAGALAVALVGLRFARFWRTPIYVLLGVAMWLAARESGVHPSVVGVVLGLLVNVYAPSTTAIQRVQVLGRSFLADPTPARALAARAGFTETVAPDERLQARIQPWSSYVVVPLFVVGNAGVVLDAETLGAAARSPITWGIVTGLTLGKLIGVTSGTWVALRTGLGQVPDTLRWGQLIGGAALSGIGFTVALFVTELALDDPALQNQAKIGILTGSLLAALLGWAIFRFLGSRGGQCSPSDLPVLPPRPWRPVE
ncbi:MAG: Na+/H+ antiporter NhaA [Pseudonocardiaceae bacterium]